MITEMAKRKKEGRSLPDFITIDSGEGGSATAPSRTYGISRTYN